MNNPPIYFDKELSWLSFNERVLQEAEDTSVPIVNRIRFLGIYSANLDEFFRVRVANIRRRAILESAQDTTNNEWTTLHSNIIEKVDILTTRFKSVADNIFDEIKKKRVNIIFNDQDNIAFKNKLSSAQKTWLDEFFDNRIVRHITPIIITNNTHLSSCIDDDGIYFLVALNKDTTKQFCLVEIPRFGIDRFIVLPTSSPNQEKEVVLLDDVVLFFIERLFEGVFEFDSIDAYSMKLTRDAEYNLTDEIDASLLEQMSKGIKQRIKADLVRLVHDENMPQYMLNFLRKSLKIRELDNLVPGVRYRHFSDFINFPNLGDKVLVKSEIKALNAQRFAQFPSVFEAISQNDILLYYPYHKFRHFTEFVRQSSYDPLVKEIKINIYRVAKNSRIIQSLIEAVKNGKKVTVVVELRARFDEEANIEWAKLMKDAGIDVEFGIETLKIHSKLCVVSREENEKLVKYAHIGTGNFHESNAKIYTDFALFTKHKEICQEVDNVFSFIAHSYKRFRFNHLIVSPLTSRRRFNQLIDNEIQIAKTGKKGEITLKLNNLVDTGLINKLYAASNAGVKVKLIIRGMCSLIPGVKELSQHIKIISIVDSFLEHPRVLIFNNGGDKQVFITSGDWMERNIDNRVEVGVPIYDETLKKRIIHTIDLHFKDNVKARIIDKKNSNKYVSSTNKPKVRSQTAIYDYLVAEENADIMMIQSKTT